MPDLPKAPLGFQIHFTDIFLEELAKVGASTLKSEDALHILSPFIYELAYNDDDRLLSEIRERIFIHLVQQSDTAFDYMEPDDTSEEEDQDDGSDTEAAEDDLETLGRDEDDSDEEEELDYNQPLDPRAGQVDVVLPQIQISYEKLALRLVEAGGQKDVKKKNKKILYALARDMNELTAGVYPLALPDPGARKPAITKREVQKAAESLVEFEEELHADKPARKNRKERKRELKNALALASDQSDEEDTPSTNVSNEQQPVADSQQTARKTTRKQKSKLKTIPTIPPPTPPAKQAKKQNSNGHIMEPKTTSTSSVPQKRKSREEPPPGSPKKARKSEPVALSLPNTPRADGLKKRVSFVLAKNLEHPHYDYQDSIQRSPAIPYDSKKQPNFGLLKSPAPSLQRLLTTPRKRASDFF